MHGPEEKPPKVFISYSHDSREHEQHVRALSDRLRREGIECIIDQYITTPAIGWQRWMMDEVEKADFVLIVASETYNRRFRGHEEPTKGFGAQWEGNIITQELYDANGKNLKFIPVLLDNSDAAHIPLPLRSATYYNVTESMSYDELYYYLSNQPPYVPPVAPQVRQRPKANP
jgi:hypothetical protein